LRSKVGLDDERIALAIARSPVPVLTGLGHEIDRSVADEVAHVMLKITNYVMLVAPVAVFAAVAAISAVSVTNAQASARRAVTRDVTK